MSLRSEILLAFDRAPAPECFAVELLAFDRVSARTFDADNRLRVDVCNISKATVNPYYGREIPGAAELGLDPDKVYKLWRHPDELEKGALTFRGLQLLDTHVPVDADSPKLERTAGAIGTDVRFENPYLKASLIVWTRRAIDQILAKKAAQLSCSYRYRADMTPGVTPGGLAYDGIMRDIVGNHVALVKEGRAGPDVYVNDSLPIGILEMSHKFPHIVAVAAAALALDAAQQTKLDVALDAKAKDAEYDTEEAMDAREEAIDSRESAMDEAEEKTDEKKEGEKARGDRKSARDKRAADRAKRAGDRKTAKDKAKDKKMGKDTDPVLDPLESKLKGGESSVSNKASDSVTKADFEAGVKRASDEAVARVEAREQAKRDVAPLVGPITVAMDSAESVYRFALDQVKVAHKDIHASALSAVVAAEIRARKGATKPANDAVQTEHSITSIFGAK